MTQYTTIEDAILAITQLSGIEILYNTQRFIALLSDYAPNLIEMQHIIRKFARADGFISVIRDIEETKSSVSVLSKICLKAVQATNNDEERHEIVRIIKNLLLILDKRYSEPRDSTSVFDEGMNFYRKYPREDNMPVALLILEEAWQLGCVNALHYISSSYLKGKGIQKDTCKGMYYLNLAANNHNVEASIELATYLWKGINTEKNPSMAVSILKNIDDPNAMFMLGDIFRENYEYSKAFEYYLMAAQRNHVYAQYNVAVACATGQGTKRNISEAKKWLRSAASLGHSDARKKLEELGEI